MTPRISIITPSYNQGQFLEDTILSILSQDYPNLEYIIIDGGSTDNSVDIIKKYEKHLAYWVSEKDRGQTHAINKGFKKATGEIVNWLNSDDLLAPNALSALAAGAAENPDADFYYGDYSVVDVNGAPMLVRKSAPYLFQSLFWGRQLSNQPSVFFKRSLLEEIGYLDETKQFCMDTEFWIRAAVNGCTFQQIKSELGITRLHAETKTALLQQRLHEEHKMIVNKHRTDKGGPSDINNTYFIFLNRFFRFINAARRCMFRGDTTLLRTQRLMNNLSTRDIS